MIGEKCTIGTTIYFFNDLTLERHIPNEEHTIDTKSGRKYLEVDLNVVPGAPF